MKDIDRYIIKIIKTLDCNVEEKEDIRLEFKDHLNMLTQEYLEKGYSIDEATKMAIKDFGNERIVGSEMNKSVSRYRRIIKKVLKVLWWSYFAVVVYVLLLRPYSPVRVHAGMINLMPFKQIITYIVRFGHYNFDTWFYNLIGNIILFMPFGFMLPLYYRKGNNVKSNLFYTFMLSFFIEFSQNILLRGVFDVDDIILNVLGGLLGFGVYKLFFHLLKHKNKEYLI